MLWKLQRQDSGKEVLLAYHHVENGLRVTLNIYLELSDRESDANDFYSLTAGVVLGSFHCTGALLARGQLTFS